METGVFPALFPIPLPCQLARWGCPELGSPLPGTGSGRREDAPGCAGTGEGGGHVTHSPGCQK